MVRVVKAYSGYWEHRSAGEHLRLHDVASTAPRVNSSASFFCCSVADLSSPSHRPIALTNHALQVEPYRILNNISAGDVICRGIRRCPHRMDRAVGRRSSLSAASGIATTSEILKIAALPIIGLESFGPASGACFEYS